MLDIRMEEELVRYMGAIKAMDSEMGGRLLLFAQYQQAMANFLVYISSDDNMLTDEEMKFINDITGLSYGRDSYRQMMQMNYNNTPCTLPYFIESLVALDNKFGAETPFIKQPVKRNNYRSWKALEIFAKIGNRFAAFEASETDNISKMSRRVDYLNVMAAILEEYPMDIEYDRKKPYLPQVPGFALTGSYDEKLKVLEFMEETNVFGMAPEHEALRHGIDFINDFTKLHTRFLNGMITDKEKEKYKESIALGASPIPEYSTPDECDGINYNESEGDQSEIRKAAEKMYSEWHVKYDDSLSSDDEECEEPCVFCLNDEDESDDLYKAVQDERKKLERKAQELMAKKEAQAKKEAEAEESNEYPYKDKTLGELITELENLTGLKTVKDRVNSNVNLMRINKLRKQRGFATLAPTKHMVFTGNPGTGKTTIARLIAAIYRELKIVSKGQFIETDAEGLIGAYVGQTAIKTKELVKKALGGILFIDEAYSLANEKGSINDFGKEAVSTLIKLMEDNREDLVVIFAGYPKQMQEFLSMNPGIRSRINTYIDFPDYDSADLTEIFKTMCVNAGYKPTKECIEYTRDYFESRTSKKIENFANARDVRNYLEKAVTNQADRLMENYDESMSDTDILTLKKQDVVKINLSEQDAPEEKHHPLGFAIG